MTGVVTPDDGSTLFVVDWVLSAASIADVRAAHHALEEASRRMAAEGESVRCVRSTYLPGQRRWLCMFTASSADVVRRTHEIAQIPASRIEEAIDLLGHRQST